MKTSNNIFVYGSLRKDINNEYFRLIQKNSNYLGTGYIEGKLYDLGEYPGAIPSRGGKDVVVGEVHELIEKKCESILKILDEYEEFRVSSYKTSEFRRCIEKVILKDNEVINAWVYWYNFPIDNKPFVPGGDYLRYRKKLITVR